MNANGGMTQFDVALAGGAVTSPAWLQLFESVVQYYLLVGGAILLTIRIAIALRDWRAVKRRENSRQDH